MDSNEYFDPTAATAYVVQDYTGVQPHIKLKMGVSVSRELGVPCSYLPKLTIRKTRFAR
jgi:hypothetical protein